MSSPASKHSSNSVALMIFDLRSAGAVRGEEPHPAAPAYMDGSLALGAE